MAIRDTRAVRGQPADQVGVILIVDDDPLLGTLMQRALSRSGQASLLATSPIEAIALAARHSIALLVTDFMMPGMTGLELAGRIREQHRDIPVILVSGSPEAGSVMIEPPSAFLAKPLAMADLATAVSSFAVLSPTTR